MTPLQSMRYIGNASMYGDHLKTKGRLNTSIGNIQADVDIAGLGSDALDVKTSGEIFHLELGKLLHVNDLHNANADFKIASKNGSTKFDTKIHTINYNDYTYSNANASGNYTSNILTANMAINDPNVDAQLYAGISFKGSSPQTTAVFEINKSNLLPLHFTKNQFHSQENPC